MKKHWNKILEWGLWLVGCLPLFAACSLLHPAQNTQKPAVGSVTVSQSGFH